MAKFQKEAEKAVSTNRSTWDGTLDDEMYNVDIHVWRKTGMGNSIQTIYGDKISISVAMTSLFKTLMSKANYTQKELKDMVDLAAKGDLD